jgi:hypothetical protein
VTVHLIQGLPVATYELSGIKLVELELSDGDGELCIVTMYGELARHLGRELVRYGKVADQP